MSTKPSMCAFDDVINFKTDFMKSTILKFGIFMLLLTVSGFYSCSKNEETNDTELDAYVEELVFRTQETANLGRFGCYELVFPVTIAFPNGQNAEANSYQEIAQVIRRWRAANPRVRTRPVIAFPYSVVTEDGTLILVENQRQEMELRRECRRTFFENNGHQGHNDRPKICFKPVLPFSVQMPDGSIFTVNNREDLRAMQQAIREWRRNNPGSNARPVLVFPANFQLEDGTTVTINSREELKALKDNCN